MSLQSFPNSELERAGIRKPTGERLLGVPVVKVQKPKPKEDEVPKVYFKMSEASKMIGENAPMIRFWEQELGMVMKRRNSRGDRMYKLEDIERLRLIARAAKDLAIESIKRLLNEGPGRLEEVVAALEVRKPLIEGAPV